jgi:hypothetical protein
MEDGDSSLHSNATWPHTAYDFIMNVYFKTNGVFIRITITLTLSRHLLNQISDATKHII